MQKSCGEAFLYIQARTEELFKVTGNNSEMMQVRDMVTSDD